MIVILQIFFTLVCLLCVNRNNRWELKQTHPICKDRGGTRIYPELERTGRPYYHSGTWGRGKDWYDAFDCSWLQPSVILCVILFSPCSSVICLLFLVLLFPAFQYLLSQTKQTGSFSGADVQPLQMDSCHKRCDGGQCWDITVFSPLFYPAYTQFCENSFHLDFYFLLWLTGSLSI